MNSSCHKQHSECSKDHERAEGHCGLQGQLARRYSPDHPACCCDKSQQRRKEQRGQRIVAKVQAEHRRQLHIAHAHGSGRDEADQKISPAQQEHPQGSLQNSGQPIAADAQAKNKDQAGNEPQAHKPIRQSMAGDIFLREQETQNSKAEHLEHHEDRFEGTF